MNDEQWMMSNEQGSNINEQWTMKTKQGYMIYER